jgi:hypothetical protein
MRSHFVLAGSLFLLLLTGLLFFDLLLAMFIHLSYVWKKPHPWLFRVLLELQVL